MIPAEHCASGAAVPGEIRHCRRGDDAGDEDEEPDEHGGHLLSPPRSKGAQTARSRPAHRPLTEEGIPRRLDKIARLNQASKGVTPVAKMLFRLPRAASVIENPSREDAKELAAKMPNARRRGYGNLNVQTASSRARSARRSSSPTSPTARTSRSRARKARKWAEAPGRLHRGAGHDRDRRLHRRTTRSSARRRASSSRRRTRTSPAMQQQLYFDPDDGDARARADGHLHAEPQGRGLPGRPLIAVDLEQGVTRVFNSDYFGESKKGGLRMWNKLVYDRGGLPLHAGCKIIPTRRGDRVGLIVGLSGTGKTTTTFTRQNGSLPVQDDFVAWMPDGRIMATENGCFAKTFGLNPDDEPTIYGAVTQPDSYLENVSQHGDDVDFFDTSYTQNGRATFPFRVIESGVDERDRRGALPADPEPEREHHPGGGEARGAAGSGLLHARRDAGHERGRRRRGRQVPARARDEPVLPDAARPPGQPLPRTARGAPARGVPHEHRARGRR